MDYEKFKEQFTRDVKGKLYAKGIEVNINVNRVNKVNESYEAMTVKPENSNIGVNIGINKFFEAIESGTPYEDVVNKATEVISNGFENKPQIDVASLSDYQSSSVAKYFRINTGLWQSDTAVNTEANLVLTLQNYGSNVDYSFVWGQEHTMAERSGDSTTNFIEWVNECVKEEAQ